MVTLPITIQIILFYRFGIASCCCDEWR